MPPNLALLLWFVLLLGLLHFDPAKNPRPSLALWVPLTWMFIVGSRLPSQWLGIQVGTVAQALDEGNPVDRSIFLLLILLGFSILISRSFRWGDFFARNFALTAFLAFALVSVLWSDFLFVSFKRWFRDLGTYLMILVVLSDPNPTQAIRTLLRRLAYLLIPLSILLVKYYPYIGKQYSTWTGADMFVGATTSKNMLGAACLVSGLFFFWDTVTRWPERKERRTRAIIAVNVAFLAMTLWLLNLSNSATSRVCLVIGCLVIVAAHSGSGKRHPTFLKTVIPAGICFYLILAFGFGLNGEFAQDVGRNPTLTDRTEIWSTVLSMQPSPLVGTGYESFWLGPRLKSIWQKYGVGLNEAHNGYLEVYLNLGLFGLFLLVGFLITSYRMICRRLTPFSSLGSLSLALWTIMLFYNITEAAFKFHLMWMTFLLGVVAVPGLVEDPVRNVAAAETTDATERFPGLSGESSGWRAKSSFTRANTEISLSKTTPIPARNHERRTY